MSDPPEDDPRNWFRKRLSLYWLDASLMFLAIGPPLLSAWISYGTGETHWFQRSGSLTVLFAGILEYRHTIQDMKVREEAWAAAKRRSWLGIAFSGQLPTAGPFLAIVALFLIVFGTVIWGYGDLLISYVIPEMVPPNC